MTRVASQQIRAGTEQPTRAGTQQSGPGSPRLRSDPARDDLLHGVRDRLARAGPHPTREQVVDALHAGDVLLGSDALDELVGVVRAEVFGAGPLQELLDDPTATDVLVNGPADVWVDRGSGLVRVGVDLGSDQDVRDLAVRLAAAGGQRLDDSSPTVDARLPDGTRLHAVLAPLCPAGAVISLRTLRAQAFTLDELADAQTVPPGWVPVLEAIVGARASYLVSGATGSGKTTLLASLLSLVPASERIITIEEARELVPSHPHVVPLTARRPNVEGTGGVDLADLVRTALRMRPDRIVLGECRGAEVRDVLTALNTGHAGGSATIHANTARDVPARLEALAALASMPAAALVAQAVSAFDAVLHLRRRSRRTDAGADPGDSRRYLEEIAVVGRAPDGSLEVAPALTWDGESTPLRHPGWEDLAHRLGLG